MLVLNKHDKHARILTFLGSEVAQSFQWIFFHLVKGQSKLGLNKPLSFWIRKSVAPQLFYFSQIGLRAEKDPCPAPHETEAQGDEMSWMGSSWRSSHSELLRILCVITSTSIVSLGRKRFINSLCLPFPAVSYVSFYVFGVMFWEKKKKRSNNLPSLVASFSHFFVLNMNLTRYTNY